MLMDMSSWNNSLHAYGIRTKEICREKRWSDEQTCSKGSTSSSRKAKALALQVDESGL